MIVMTDNERFYLKPWMFNACRLLSALAKIVENNDGKVKYGHPAVISDRNTEDDPIVVTHATYISFVLDGMYYYYQVDENPFFEFYYQKIPVTNGRYSKDRYLEEDKKEWLYDCFFQSHCSQADIVEGANLIFNMLINAKPSGIYREYVKTRVPNTYDDGYHYEKIAKPERIGEIDF